MGEQEICCRQGIDSRQDPVNTEQSLAEPLISECKVPANCCTKFEIIPVLKSITCWKAEHLTMIKLQWVGQKAALGFGGKRYLGYLDLVCRMASAT